MLHDQADRNACTALTMPVTVIQQDWGAALGYNASALWSAWAPKLRHITLNSGHFMAEENPEAVSQAQRELMQS
ncbi:pimeloyl-ACP methyl ester carboxylesterase [Pseudarthrobacter sp. PvP004]|uniref:hypothetical protein n=1 Tax=Pseudarthrobacter sp. PvP004 TaxID=2817850 RepID=UPI001AE4F767|nr:hypothetical protein [Pseudarthrobacter sp. PvP004]MBP2266177.1 pimeloyl-ACP methyl ester carboxylesterase [Pseudarthrobacter sp. PvP004]